MEELMMIRPQACQGQTVVPAQGETLSVCRDSHAVTKIKPKIRIVHVFTPEIIKTDIANFRDLVQKLTGKQATGRRHGKITKTVKAKQGLMVSSTDDSEKASSGHGGCLKGEEKDGMWVGEVNSSSLISGLEDMDDFIQSLIQYPQVPLGYSNLLES